MKSLVKAVSMKMFKVATCLMAALAAIREFRFKPAEVDDTVLLVDAVIRFAFRLKSSSSNVTGDYYP